MLLPQLQQLFLHATDDFSGSVADDFQRRVQLLQLPAAAPPGYVPEGVIRRIQTEVFTASERYRLRLYLSGAFIELRRFIFQ